VRPADGSVFRLRDDERVDGSGVRWDGRRIGGLVGGAEAGPEASQLGAA